MRQSSPGARRPRGRHNNNGNNGASGGGRSGDGRVRSASSLRHQTFDSNGPDVRVRGNAWQVYEKYLSLARDASSSGDRVMAENYLQHAEHYYRITEAIEEATAAEQRQRNGAGGQPFAAQPEMPANYYTPDGQLAAGAPQPAAKQQQAPQSKAKPAAASAAPQQQAQAPQPALDGAAAPSSFDAKVEPKRAKPAEKKEEEKKDSPFFSVDDAAEEPDSGPQTLVAQR
ncbi:MAG: DUF4167 domain-containing protein [Bdellovibrionales bacterium]